MRKYLFGMVCLRGSGKKQIKSEEFIVAETWEQANEYWSVELKDQAVEVLEIKKHVPVIAIIPGLTTRTTTK